MAGLIVFDPDNEEVGLSTGDDIALNTYLDIRNDVLYFTDGESIYAWEQADDGTRQTYIWRSGEVRLPYPVNMGAALVEAEAYSETNVGGTEGDLLWDGVLFQADFEGTDGATTYTEESPYAAVATFTGSAHIEDTNPIADTTSLQLAGDAIAGERVSFPIQTADLPAWDGTGQFLTLEMAFRMDTLQASGTKYLLQVGDEDFQILRLAVYVSGGIYRLRAGFSNSGGLTDPITIVQGTDYEVVVEADYSGGAGSGVERVWFGPRGGPLTLVDTTTGLTAKDPTTLATELLYFGNLAGTGSSYFGANATIDHVRITNSTTGRYASAGATISTDLPPTYYTQAGVAGADYDIIFRLYADGVLKHTQTVLDDEPFRLPGGYLSNIYSFEIESAMPVTRVSIAENIFELAEG